MLKLKRVSSGYTPPECTRHGSGDGDACAVALRVGGLEQTPDARRQEWPRPQGVVAPRCERRHTRYPAASHRIPQHARRRHEVTRGQCSATMAWDARLAIGYPRWPQRRRCGVGTGQAGRCSRLDTWTPTVPYPPVAAQHTTATGLSTLEDNAVGCGIHEAAATSVAAVACRLHHIQLLNAFVARPAHADTAQLVPHTMCTCTHTETHTLDTPPLLGHAPAHPVLPCKSYAVLVAQRGSGSGWEGHRTTTTTTTPPPLAAPAVIRCTLPQPHPHPPPPSLPLLPLLPR